MSQIKLLLDVVSDMRHLADSLAEYANAVTTNWTIVNNLDTKRRKEKRLK